ncbi:hypothetical protein LZ31DRAFT_590822 [Colletotrichum somersetense]|nr:hypothetical protein LZ31DRAFT_590822 [Colletotrichum somersetense]
MSGHDGSSSSTHNDEAVATRAKEDALGKVFLGRTQAATRGLAAANLVGPAIPSAKAGPRPRPVKRLRITAPEPESEFMFAERKAKEEGSRLVESDVPCLPCANAAAIRGSGKGVCFKVESSNLCFHCSLKDSCLRCDPTPAIARAAVAELRELLEVSSEERNTRWPTARLLNVAAARDHLRYMLSNAEVSTDAVLTVAKKEKKDKQEKKSKKEKKMVKHASQGSPDYEAKKASLLDAVTGSSGQ